MDQKKVKLLKPHTHAGRDYPAGAELSIDADSADWLIGLSVAVEVLPKKRLSDEGRE